MPVHNPTLSELVGNGYVELNVHCAHCRFLVVLPLDGMMRQRGQMITIKEIGSKLKCRQCGNAPASVTAQMLGRYGAYGA